MKAIRFKQVNRILKAGGCHDLPACFDGHYIVFCWKLSLRERLKVLFTGKLWHTIWSKQCIIQPVCLEVNNPLVKGPGRVARFFWRLFGVTKFGIPNLKPGTIPPPKCKKPKGEVKDGREN